MIMIMIVMMIMMMVILILVMIVRESKTARICPSKSPFPVCRRTRLASP